MHVRAAGPAAWVPEHSERPLVSQLTPGLISPQVLWLPDGFREQVRRQAPGFQQIYGLKSSWNETESPLRVNLPYQDISTEEIG